MSKFKKGQKVWVWRYHSYEETTKVVEMVYVKDDRLMGLHEIKNKQGDTYRVGEDRVFPTSQECIDHIINSIKVIPYEETSDN